MENKRGKKNGIIKYEGGWMNNISEAIKPGNKRYNNTWKLPGKINKEENKVWYVCVKSCECTFCGYKVFLYYLGVMCFIKIVYIR